MYLFLVGIPNFAGDLSERQISSFKLMEEFWIYAIQIILEPILHIFLSSGRIGACRLRHSSSLERDSSPTGSLPTEWPGSMQERQAWVKHSWSMITLLVRHAEPERLPFKHALMFRTLKLKRFLVTGS